jgi:hypothetical protein
MNRAELRSASRRHRPIRLDDSPLPDTHPLAFVRDHAEAEGLGHAQSAIEAGAAKINHVPGPISLCDVTYLALTRYGYDPLTTVVYHLDVHGVCTLKEFAQVALVDLPIHVRREKIYHMVQDDMIQDDSGSDGDTASTAGRALLVGSTPTDMQVIAEEGPEVIAAARFEPTLAILTREDAEVLFDGSSARPQRLWPVAHEDRLEFLGMTGAGYTATTLDETLAYLPRHPPE